VARTGVTELRTGFWWENLKEIDGVGDQGIGRKKYQNKSYRNRLGGCRMDLSGSR
jgi:hypothetical protein